MLEEISEKTRRTRTGRKCDVCGGWIDAGDTYSAKRARDEKGVASSYSVHLACEPRWLDWCGEFSDFYESDDDPIEGIDIDEEEYY